MGVWEKVIQSEEVQGVNGQVTYTQNSVNYGYLFLLLLSYFFTHQVIQNTTHVTVSGTVGSWCTFIFVNVKDLCVCVCVSCARINM